MKPFAELHPERLPWPQIAGLDLVVEGPPLRLIPATNRIEDAALDAGFEVRWTLKALGQRLDPQPHFSAKIVKAEVLSSEGGRTLLYWAASPDPFASHNGRNSPRRSPHSMENQSGFL